MPKADPVHRSDESFSGQLLLFARAVGAYASVLGLTPEQVASQAADAAFFDYIRLGQHMMQKSTQQWTTAKDELRRGSDEQLVAPLPPVFGPAPAAVRGGVEARFRALIRQIKAHGNYNSSIGAALGIEGAERTGPDLATVQPELEVKVSGEVVHIDWSWQRNAAYLDMIELRVDRGDGRGAVFLAHDTTPGYIDSHPFPAEPTKWTYTAIFWLNDRPTGRWSMPVAVLLGG